MVQLLFLPEELKGFQGLGGGRTYKMERDWDSEPKGKSPSEHRQSIIV